MGDGMPGVWSLKAVLPDFVDMNFFWSQNGRERRSVYRKFTESSRLRSVVVQSLEALWLLTSWDFEGRIRFEVRDPFHPHANKVLMVQRTFL